jgi:Transport and Golgi organisation 2
MCTVSVVPANGTYIFTFNRDEKPERHTLHFICRNKLAHKEIYFTKDSKAGGSWFAADSRGNVIMLFNGAFKKHVKQAFYKKSRGIILMEMAAAADMLLFFKSMLLHTVEPFSVVLFEDKNLYRLTWDGLDKHETLLLNETGYIFSSATLYNDDVQQQRRQWLAGYLMNTAIANGEAVFNFHTGYNKHDKENGLIIERPQGCHTLSISQAVVSDAGIQLKHVDLKTGQKHLQSILLSAEIEVSFT